MRKEFFGIFVIIALIFSLTLTNVSITSPADLPFVSVDPLTTEIGVGIIFDINITVTNVTDPDLYSWSANLTFNPDILDCIGAEEGPFLKNVWPWWTEWMDPKINNEQGYVEVSCGYNVAVPWGATGSGTLATISFKAGAVGSTPLNFSETVLSSVNKTSGSSLPIDQDPPVNGTVTVASGHDVAVVSVTAPAEAASNSNVPINVTVKNEGSYIEEANVTISYGTTYIDSENVTLNAGASQTVAFNWTTTGVAADTYTVNATATIPEDADPTDNSKTTEIRIVEHDVAVTAVDVPSKAKVGATVPINVTVENQGAFTENLNVTVSYDATLIGFNDTVVLPAQNSAILSFDWDTTSVAAGTYTVNATATIPVDDDPTDNSKTKPIELYLFHDVAVISIEVPTDAPLGDMVSINVTVKNEGDFDEEEVNVTIRYSPAWTYIDSETFSLAQGENNTALFTWNTTGLTPGLYTIKANATIPVDDDLADNTRTKTIRLTVHDVAVVNITAPPKGYANSSVVIAVTVENQGSFWENVTVTLKYDGTFIGNKTVGVVMGVSADVSFTWYTTGVTPGNYNLTANATVLESIFNSEGIDDDPADNTLDDVTVFITIAGDVDGDGTVNNSDLSDLNEAYGSEPGDSNWDPNCDFNNDGKVDALDIFDLSKNYGRSI